MLISDLFLDEGSRKYLTVNTRKGLFQPTRLQYDIHSAAGIFQREMEKRSRMDDIIISGKNDNEHSRSLESVLGIVEKCGL